MLKRQLGDEERVRRPYHSTNCFKNSVRQGLFLYGKFKNNNYINFSIHFIICLMLVLFSVANIMSLGVTPGRSTINYEPGLEKDISFSVLNSEHKNMDVIFVVQGELSGSITMFKSGASFIPSEGSKSFNYRVNLPAGLELEPGLHTAEVVIMEVPKANAQGTFVGATVAVVSQLHVYVACPGKCIDIDVNVLDAEANGTATFIIPIVNRGELGIGEARAVIDIYTPLNEKIASVDTDYMPIDAGSRTELVGKWEINGPSGSYLAKVTVFYDGESKSMEHQFMVGDQALSIESILVNNFQLGQIAKLQILVENKFNHELKSVFANLLVYNEREQVMADIKSASQEIPALSKKELIAYWDTVGVEEGEYNGKLMVDYGLKSTDRNLVLKVSQDNLDVFGVGYAIRPSGGGGTDMTTILLIIVILLLLVNLSWFVFYKRIMAGRKK